jgi:hypothetical protein
MTTYPVVQQKMVMDRGPQDLYRYKCPVCSVIVDLSGDQVDLSSRDSNGLYTPDCGHTVKLAC